jgi:SAM-dependent methyltransferase
MKKTNRLYNDLAWLWPLWGSVDDYKKECEIFAKLIQHYSKIESYSLLDITCGGGKNDFHLKKYFEVTGLDISPAMLANAKKLNPECTYVVEDMRDFDLGCKFDAVLINDGLNYITTEQDLSKTFQNAYKHLRMGGVMICFAETYKGKFQQNKTYVSTSKKNDLEITFIENNYDPNPCDNTYESTIIYLIREKGKLRIEHDLHIGGIFELQVWKHSLKKAGFEIHELKEQISGDEILVFACVKK